VVVAAMVVPVAGPAVATPALDISSTTRVSVASDGAQANWFSEVGSISGNGRFVAFDSFATNLVPGDTNGFSDVFVRDRETGTTERISVSSAGVQGNQASFITGNSVSADGRYVAFISGAENLVPGPSNGAGNVYVRDRLAGTTERISVSSSGTLGNGAAGGGAISADGRYVAFESDSSNLVPGDTNGTFDVFVRDRMTNTTTRVSVASDGTQANDRSDLPVISADGRYVAFPSPASNLVPGDTNGVRDVFVRDTVAGTTTRVSVASDGSQANGESALFFTAISGNGRFVAFGSFATNLVPGDTNGAWDIFVRDRATNTTSRISLANDGSQGNGPSFAPTVSNDGRFVAFVSVATNLVPGDTNGESDVFIRDRWAGSTSRISVSSGLVQGNGSSGRPEISAEGRDIVFVSVASNLVPGDTNGFSDVFVRHRSS
jgi:Tol biopolymer transport system component